VGNLQRELPRSLSLWERVRVRAWRFALNYTFSLLNKSQRELLRSEVNFNVDLTRKPSSPTFLPEGEGSLHHADWIDFQIH
jgi:hypothetical protein